VVYAYYFAMLRPPEKVKPHQNLGEIMLRSFVLLVIGLALVFPSSAQTPSATVLAINYDDALKRARENSPELLAAQTSASLAKEDRLQARAALLPDVNWMNGFIYTQPNGRESGVFVSNDGTHVYNNQAVVHGEILSLTKLAERRMAIAAEAAAIARTEIVSRGLTVVVTEDYYGLVAAQRKNADAKQSLEEAERFLEVSQKLEEGGEAARSDVVKAQVQAEQRRREAQDTELAAEKARIGLAVLIFTDFQQAYQVVDDLEQLPTLPPYDQAQALAAKNNPDVRAAELAVSQERFGVKAARGEMLPSLTFDYFYGINAREYAIYDPEHFRNLGSSIQVELNIPVWNWGATRSKIRQAELRVRQAQRELSFTQKNVLADLKSFHREAEVAGTQVASLRRSADLAAESLRLTLLGYQAGEATALEVVDAQATLIEARNALADGLLRYRLALASLQTITGAF
jgi:outer membrane protein TolC